MLEKIKEFWSNHKTSVIITLVAILIIALSVTIASYTYQGPSKEQGASSVVFYGLLTSWSNWFSPILKTLIGIACLKYIILDW